MNPDSALRLLPLGSYKVDVTLDGFKNFSQTGILLEVGRNARVDATIEPGAVAEVVSVVADSHSSRPPPRRSHARSGRTTSSISRW